MSPDEFTASEGFLDVGNGHQIYIQDWGNKKAKTPIILLHGGPGGGVSNYHKGLFNPYEHRVIFFDQRGCGRSLPYGELRHNTTADLVSDIEKIADHFGLSHFAMTGGSWGSCLALAYTLAHPTRVVGLVLRALFTGSKYEIDYVNNGGFRTFFPDIWAEYLEKTPKSYHSNPTDYHFNRILKGSEQEARQSAYIFSTVESSLLKLDDRYSAADPTTFDPIGVTIEAHYLSNLCFMPDKYILNNAHKIGVHIWLVQGRYDFVCPPSTAYDLHQRLPNSTLLWTVAGHSGSDRSNYDVIRTILSQWG